MSRTYKYPRESLEDTATRKEFGARERIQKKLERRKHSRKERIKASRSFIKNIISFRDKQRSKG